MGGLGWILLLVGFGMMGGAWWNYYLVNNFRFMAAGQGVGAVAHLFGGGGK